MSTKVSCYLTNHHTTSTSDWASYRWKYADATLGLSAVWTVGHFVTTRGSLRWIFSFLDDNMDVLFGGSSLSGAASSAFAVGHDIALRLRQAPAGARYPGNVVAVANRFVESA